MALQDFSGGTTIRIGPGIAPGIDGLAKMFEYASPETEAFGLRLYHPFWGRATVPNGSTTVAVVFDQPRMTADYIVFLAFDESPGSATVVYPASKAVTGFTITVDLDPGADADVSWLVVG